MKLVNTYTRSQTQWRNLPDRALPVMFVRWGDVEVYRPTNNLLSKLGFGFFDKEIVNWEDWREMPVDWSAS